MAFNPGQVAAAVWVGGGGVAPGGAGAGAIQVYNATTYLVPNTGAPAKAKLDALLASTTNLGAPSFQIIAGTLYLPPGAYGLEASFTVPPNVRLWMAKGAHFVALVPGVTLTINGDVDLPLDTVFDNSLNPFAVVFGSSSVDTVYPQWWGATANGATDDVLAILAADVAALTNGADLSFPPGTYKHSQNLIVAHRWKGVPLRTILKPTAAVTKCLDFRNFGDVSGFYLDGVNTNGATGADLGSSQLISETRFRDSQIWRFLGVGGRGIKTAQIVTGKFSNLYVDGNYINLHTNGGNTPTDCEFRNCQFREATTKGVWIETGYGIRFYKPLFEANGEEGLYFQNVGGNAIEIGIYEPWYEANWQSVAAGAARHAKYHFFVDGANGPAATIRFSQRDAKFNEGVTDPRAMHITNALGYTDFNCKVANEAGQILVDGTSFGNFEAWNGLNGPFATVVTNSSSAGGIGAWSNRSHLEDNIEAAMTPYVPVLTPGGTMTYGAQVINVARYKLVGKRLWLDLYFTGTTGGVQSDNISVSLPLGLQPKNADFYCPATSVDPAFSLATVRMPTGASIITFYRAGGVFTAGAGRGFSATLSLEVL